MARIDRGARQQTGNNDRFYPEIFGYLLMLANAGLLVMLWRRIGAFFGVLALVVVVIAAGDLFMIQERVGARLDAGRFLHRGETAVRRMSARRRSGSSPYWSSRRYWCVPTSDLAVPLSASRTS